MTKVNRLGRELLLAALVMLASLSAAKAETGAEEAIEVPEDSSDWLHGCSSAVQPTNPLERLYTARTPNPS